MKHNVPLALSAVLIVEIIVWFGGSVRADETATNSWSTIPASNLSCTNRIGDDSYFEHYRSRELLIIPQQDSISFAGQNLKITQGQVPLSMDPLESPAQKALDAEKYQRVELFGNGKGLFFSEAEGVGLHCSERVLPNTAVFVKLSENSFGIRFSNNFNRYPFDTLFTSSGE